MIFIAIDFTILKNMNNEIVIRIIGVLQLF